MCQKPFVSRAPLESLQHSPDLLVEFGDRIPGAGNGYKGNGGKEEENERVMRGEGKGRKEQRATLPVPGVRDRVGIGYNVN